MKKFLAIAFLLSTFYTSSTSSQEDASATFGLEAGFDVATTYLWRGFEIGNGPVVQPWTRVSYGGASAGVWATTNLTGDSKEVDLYASYTYKNVTLSFTDLFSMGVAGLSQDFFNFAGATSTHLAELGLSYNGSPQFPLTLSGGVFLYGQASDPSSSHAGKMNHSTYFEVGCPGTYKDYSYALFAGFVPTESSFYNTESFAFINVGCKVGKSLQVTPQFTLPTTLTLAVSPERKTVCLAAMCSF